jgi:hypothetical protein
MVLVKIRYPCRKDELGSNLIFYIKINSKWFIFRNLNIKEKKELT